MKRPIVCGHRGAMAVSPENTMASFRAAADLGATWVEFDVRPTADGTLVIHHDPDTQGAVNIATTNFADLQDIARFADLATGLPSLGLDIEMKTDDIGMSLDDFADLVISEIDLYRPSLENILVTSFDAEVLAIIRNRRADIATGLLFWKKSGDWAIRTAVEAGHVAIAPWIKLLTVELVEQANEAGLDVATWTVNDPDQIRLAIDAGVDMIIGDNPATILEHL